MLPFNPFNNSLSLFLFNSLPCLTFLPIERKQNLLRVFEKHVMLKKYHLNENTFEVRKNERNFISFFINICVVCVVYTWDHRSSAIIWNILKVQPLLSDEVQAFKALILVHRTINEGHPNVTK